MEREKMITKLRTETRLLKKGDRIEMVSGDPLIVDHIREVHTKGIVRYDVLLEGGRVIGARSNMTFIVERGSLVA